MGKELLQTQRARRTEKFGPNVSTVVILLPGVLSPKVSMLPLQLHLKHNGFQNTSTIDLKWSTEKFEKLVEYAVSGIETQVKKFKKTHNENNPDNIVIIGFSNGGAIGAKAIEIIKDMGVLPVNPKLITMATAAKSGERTHSTPLKIALSLASSYRQRPEVGFPKDWTAIYSLDDGIVDPERTKSDKNGNKPQEAIEIKSGLKHFQMMDPRKTGNVLINLLNKITSEMV